MTIEPCNLLTQGPLTVGVWPDQKQPAVYEATDSPATRASGETHSPGEVPDRLSRSGYGHDECRVRCGKRKAPALDGPDALRHAPFRWFAEFDNAPVRCVVITLDGDGNNQDM